MKMMFVVFSICFAFLIGECISSSITPRVIGGENAGISRFPHQAMIRLRGGYHCSACILGKKNVLGAASCFFDFNGVLLPYSDLTVHTGTNTIHVPGHTHTIADVFFPPGWDIRTMANDLVVIEVNEDIVFDEEQQKIALPEHDIVSPSQAILTGWGQTRKRNTNFADRLQQITMTLLNRNDCQPMYPRPLAEDHICAYHPQKHGGSVGDAGAPLVVDNHVAAIFSHTVEIGRRPISDMQIVSNVFTNKAFIQSKIRND